jgi:hypothetical protein
MEWHNFGRAVPYETLTHLHPCTLQSPLHTLPLCLGAMPLLAYLALEKDDSWFSLYDAIVRRCPNLRMLVITLVSDSKDCPVPCHNYRVLRA